MRSFLVVILLLFVTPCLIVGAYAQSACPAGTATTISGIVTTPNATDPLPNALVYVPSTAVAPFTPGVSCPVVGAPPSGTPIAGAQTGVDGSFTVTGMPSGTNIPLVVVSGRWRRQITIPTVAACTNTVVNVSMPQNHTQGDIPLIAIATGSSDQVECVLRKVGISDSEFTDPGGGGRINIFKGTGSPGAQVDASTPSASTLMGNYATLSQYDVLMLPCEGSPYPADKTLQEYANLLAFANAGGRVYASHYSYQWMYDGGAGPFPTVANWLNSGNAIGDDLPATVNTSFGEGATLATWLSEVGASTVAAPTQISLSAVKHDIDGVNSPTQSWLTLNQAYAGDPAPVMQFVWDTPVAPTGTTGAYCGKVLFNEYHVENPPTSPAGKTFPVECASSTPMTPQEKLLEYSLFELTNDGGTATLTPTSQDFGTEPIGFNSAVHTFTWTNNSSFPASVASATGSGDFSVTSNTCGSVAPYSSCQIGVVFNPTAIGARTGTLTVGTSASTLTSSLTGTGIADVVLSTSALTFGSLDVGASATQVMTITNSAPGPVYMPPLATTGDYSATTTCPSQIPGLGNCTISVTFKPTVAGARTGTLALSTTSVAYPSAPVALTGNGLDFSLAATPTSGSVVAGYSDTLSAVTTPLGGFDAGVTSSCTTTAPASTCSFSGGFTLSGATTTTVTLTTTSQYTVVGYSGFGGRGWLWVVVLGSGWLLWRKRGSAGLLVRSGLLLVVLAAGAMSVTGCSGKLPAENTVYTPAGTYTYTMTVTDGFLVRSATYSLTVK